MPRLGKTGPPSPLQTRIFSCYKIAFEMGFEMTTKKPRRGRPPQGKERKVTRSIRLEPTKRDLIERKHGTVQKWVDFHVERDFGRVFTAEIVPEGEADVSLDDF